MRRALLTILAVGCLAAPCAGMAQPNGGPGNSAKSGAPTIEDYITDTRGEIEKALDAHAISEARARHEQHRLDAIQHKVDHLTREVIAIHRSLPRE